VTVVCGLSPYVIRGKDDKTSESRKHRCLSLFNPNLFIIGHSVEIYGGSIVQ
jgi:hypothetical protein